MSDLLAQLMDPNGPALSEADRKKIMARLKQRKTGHAWTPGTGPTGETCKTCAHYARVRLSGVYRKCGLMQAQWTHGPGTDIRAGDPACKKWQQASEGAQE